MKRIVASVGLAALGAASIESLHAQAVGADKPWSVSASLRGFYDDNVNTAPSGEIDTFGFEVNPSFSFGVQNDQTTASLTYAYGFIWYDKRPDPTRDKHYDQTHTIAARLVHAFTERTSLTVSDSFVIGQEPDTIRTGDFYSSVQRISGQNIRNYGAISINHQFTEKIGIEAGYANSFYDYDSTLEETFPNISNSGLLDRIEQSIHLDARWTFQPTTVGFVGYMYSFSDYTGDEPIGVLGTGDIVYSKDRNSRSHYGYVGVEHTFLPELMGSVRAGARATDYYNSLEDQSDIGPYASASLRYAYAQGSHVEAGVSHDIHATDMFSVSETSITTDSESTSAYISVVHRIFPDLTGNASFTFQNSTFNGGDFDGISEQFYLFNVGLEYHINRHFSTSVSYNFDHLESDFRTYNRNRVYAGVNFVY